jgi:TonB family protein
MLSRAAPVVSILLTICALCLAQSVANTDADVRPSKLVVPAYPALARHAGVQGDIDLTLLIGEGGQVVSAVIDRGPALLELRQAVLEAARQSRFDCKSCDQKPQSYSLRYHFEAKPIDPEKYCRTYGQLDPPPGDVDIIRGQVSVYGWEEYTCDPVSEIKRFRSARCLYLWNCGRNERTLE